MRVLIADSHTNTRRGLSLLLQEENGMSAIYEASDAESVIKLAAENAVELVLLDAELPGLPIKDLVDEIHFLNPTPKVIVMSSDLEQGRKFLRDGADAFVSKSDQPEWLLSALRRLVETVKEQIHFSLKKSKMTNSKCVFMRQAKLAETGEGLEIAGTLVEGSGAMEMA